jgi:DNA mismatch repair protein MutL
MVGRKGIDEGKGAALLPSDITIKGQAGNCYIIGETRDGIVIVDQHAAHEKVVYEELRKQLGAGRVQYQELLSPVTLELSTEEADSLEHLLGDLERLGFKVEPFGGRSCIVRTVPSVLGATVEPGALHDIVSDLLKERRLGKEGLEGDTIGALRDRVIATMACHSSTRGGDTLDLLEMKELVQLLYSADEPFSCPHGRPTIIFLPFGRLEKRFGRTG